MATSVSNNTLKINVMPEDVHNHFMANDLINENELYLVEDSTVLMTNSGTVISENADYSEVGEWSDGNVNNEDRIGYFVSIDLDNSGIKIIKATSTTDVRGVTMARPGFAANAGKDKFDKDGNLLKQYDYIAFVGFVPVIDYGRCTVNGRCVSADDGTAIPSPNSMGYQIIERIDANHVLILIDPQSDMLVRIKQDIDSLDQGNWITTEDIDAMFNGTYQNT